ncbi:cytochrome c oxidase subunit 4 [Micropruina sonneratiae]|uniref:cytochrome c oxidase subunit 4 n=1 Tax=Micropruina sonneratiae TaxID=2986940 RepID=UPI0022279780|nr:cytochrome c oxidase subunit 4 [Micropruina sp. KQZ13P-5]MCW3156836.1 cytochrome c oxidase subunit 4 [Micropruina sp. KQZ13P-5]
MKVEGWMFTAIAIFLAIVSPIYWFMSHEIIGTVALVMSFLLFGMVGVYLFVLARKMDERVEDRKDAEIVEGAGAMGFFPPKSIWPFWVAITVQLLTLGPVFGWWISILAVCLGIWALSGWVFEFYRGDYQH